MEMRIIELSLRHELRNKIKFAQNDEIGQIAVCRDLRKRGDGCAVRGHLRKQQLARSVGTEGEGWSTL